MPILLVTTCYIFLVAYLWTSPFTKQVGFLVFPPYFIISLFSTACFQSNMLITCSLTPPELTLPNVVTAVVVITASGGFVSGGKTVGWLGVANG